MPDPKAGPYIQVRFRLSGEGVWRPAPANCPGDRPGSLRAFHEGELVVWCFGWVDDEPLVWRVNGGSVTFPGVRAVAPTEETVVRNLRDGSVYLKAARGSWRLWAVTL